ncbi:MAG: POTRA domain-containing protein, partial [Longimicrobiales bacterium]
MGTGLLLSMALVIAAAQPMSGQLVPVDADTRIGKVRVRFLETRSFPLERLEEELVFPGLQAPSAFRRAVGGLPGVSEVESTLFNPLELQQDVARLRSFYREAGYPQVSVGYDLALSADNTLDIDFTVGEGVPMTIRALEFLWIIDGESMEDPPAVVSSEWNDLMGRAIVRTGDRADNYEIDAMGREIVAWLGNQAYPFATFRSEISFEDPINGASVSLLITPGRRARIESVTIEGQQRLERPVIARELGLRSGDWYSATARSEGRAQVLGLDLVRSAVVDIPGRTEDDAGVDIRLRVIEGPLRLISGGTGYVSESGVAFQGQWDHRDFTGSGRVLSVSGLGETGALALGPNPDVLYRGTVSLRQPYLLDRRLSLLGSTEAEYRDDLRDESWALAGEASLVYDRGGFQALALSYRLEQRHFIDRRVGNFDPVLVNAI